MTRDEIVAAALKLLPRERAEVVEVLSESLLAYTFSNLPEAASAELERELDERLELFDSGEYFDADLALQQLCSRWGRQRGSG